MQKVRKGQEACKGLPAQQSPCKVRSQRFSSMPEDGSNKKIDRYLFSQVVHICVHRFFVEYHRLSGSCMVNN